MIKQLKCFCLFSSIIALFCMAISPAARAEMLSTTSNDAEELAFDESLSLGAKPLGTADSSAINEDFSDAGCDSDAIEDSSNSDYDSTDQAVNQTTTADDGLLTNDMIESDISDQPNEALDESESETSAEAHAGADSMVHSREWLDSMASLHANDLPDGFYAFESLGAEALVFDAKNGGGTPGTKVQLFSSNDTDAQVWQVSHDDKGYVTIANVLSGLVLDIPNGVPDSGSAVQLWTPNGSYAQKWIAVLQNDGSIVFHSALDGDIVLDVRGGLFCNGTAIQLFINNDSNAQRWLTIPTKPIRDRIKDFASQHLNDLPDGDYVFHSALNDWKALDVASGSQDDCANVDLYIYNGSPAQQWSISHDENGFVVITNAWSGKVLDVSSGVSTAGTNVQQYVFNDSWAQKWIAVLGDDGTYVFYSALDQDVVLDVANGSTADGSNVRIWTCNNSPAQAWRAENLADTEKTLNQSAQDNSSVIPDGEYIVLSDIGSRKVLDVANGSSANFANVQIYESNMTNAQRWRVSHDELGYVILTNVASGKVLDVSSGYCYPGSNVAQYEFNGSRAQKWIVDSPDGSGGLSGCTIRSALCQNLVLDIEDGETENCTNVQVYSQNGSPAQSFSFVSTSISVAPCEDILPDGWYVISPKTAEDYALDINSGSRLDGANVQLYQCNGTLAQLFRFDYHDGYYSIVSGCSGKVLDMAGGNIIPPTNVQIWSSDLDGEDAKQQFSVVDNGDGSYTFINRATGLALDVDGANYSNNANIQGYTSNGTPAQQFVIKRQSALLQEGIMEICPLYDESKVIDVASGSEVEGAAIQTYVRNGTLAQKWQVSLIDGTDNTYVIESVCSGKVLTATDAGNVVQRAYTESESQHWLPEIVDGGAYVLHNAAYDSVLCVSGSSLVAAGATYADVQKFTFSPTSPLSEGTYFIQSRLSAAMVVDVANGSRDNYANVQLYTNNDSGAQKWNITRNSDGSYSIQNAKSKKMLDVANGVGVSGANVQQYQSNGSNAQKWRIDYVGDGNFRITTLLNNNLALDVSGGNAWNGSNIQIFTLNGTKAQCFTFKPAYYEDDRVLNVDRADLLSWLESHEYDGYYIGTRYSSGFSIPTCMYPNGSPRYDGFTGMNCTGFVAHAYQSAGGDLNPISVNNNHSPWPGGPGGGSYINAWRWYGYAIDSGAEVYHFNRVVDMLASGIAEKGDIIFFKTNGSIDCHIGFFWGNSSYENRMWHQILPGNLIGPCFNNANKSEYNQQTVLIKGSDGSCRQRLGARALSLDLGIARIS